MLFHPECPAFPSQRPNCSQARRRDSFRSKETLHRKDVNKGGESPFHRFTIGIPRPRNPAKNPLADACKVEARRHPAELHPSSSRIVHKASTSGWRDHVLLSSAVFPCEVRSKRPASASFESASRSRATIASVARIAIAAARVAGTAIAGRVTATPLAAATGGGAFA